MAKAELQPIYNRLNGLDNYHPLTASTFADWSLEAGDIVTVKRGNESYSSPAHTVSLNWTGSPKVTLDSRGEKSRGSVAKLAAKNFNSGGNGGNAYRGGVRGTRKTNDRLAGIDEGLNDVTIFAHDAADDLGTELKVQAGRISAVVTEGNPPQPKAGAIVDAINGGSVKIFASKIELEGNVNLNSVLYVSSGIAIFKVPVSVSGGGGTPVQISGGSITAGSFKVRSGGVPYTLSVANVTVSGNVLTIRHTDGSTENFSKATSLSGRWSSGTYTVTAKQNEETVNTNTTTIKQLQKTGSVDVIDKNVGQDIYVYATENGGTAGVSTHFHQMIYIDASDVYEAGKASVPTYSNSATITFERSEELPSGTMRYHYYTTGTYIITSGTKTVHYN